MNLHWDKDSNDKHKGKVMMKKTIALVLAFMLAVSAVSAFAATYSDRATIQCSRR